MSEYKDFPWDECWAACERIIADGSDIYQKWTCEKCGERVMANQKNTWTEHGHHEEKLDGSPCGHITDIRKRGCNYMVITLI